MRYKKGLIQKNLKALQKREWYYQRFDGCPLFMQMVGEPHFFREKRKLKGGNFRDLLTIYSRGKVDWYINLTDIQRITKMFIEKSYKETSISKKIIAKWEKDKKKFYQKCGEVENLKIRRLSNNELLKLYQDFIRIYQKWFSMTSLVDGFALGSDEFINKKINRILEKRGITEGRGTIFSKLTSPSTLSFTNEAEFSLLKIAELIQKNQELNKIFLKEEPKIIKEKIKNFPQEFQALVKHQGSYFWLMNNYIKDIVLSLDYFIKEIKSLLGLKTDLKERIKLITQTPLQAKKEKKRLKEEFNLPCFLRNLIEISEDFTWWQDERKKSTLFTTHYVSLILKEIVKRFHWSEEELRYFTHDEIPNLFIQKGYYPSGAEVAKRIEYSVFYYNEKYYECYGGKKAKDLIEKLLGKKGVRRKVNDFRGISASLGMVKGKVKIVTSVQEINKVQKGDILVAVMTRPDYIIGIKKAGAIVTDEGGLTCHAAIVSRELGIPCIIGTKIATKVLRDGDLVEVDAEKGMVKILKR